MKNILSFVFSCLISYYSIGNTPVIIQDGNNPTLHVDFDDCVSWFNGYNEDYSEFVALSSPVENCSSIELAGPGYVYRNNTKENIHSCTPGIDSTSLGMCITAFDNCNYIAGDSTSLIFEVKVIPGANGMGSIEEVSFYEKAPEMFNFYQGQSGTNNYPTKFGIRALIDDVEVFRQDDIDTEREWNLRTFNLSDVEAFTVTDTTVFQFEILPYCLIGNGALVQAWDIDNLTITAGCNSVNAGFVKVIGNVNICQGDSLDHTLTFEAEDAFGPNLTWIILDQQGEILLLPDGNVVDFDTLDNGIYVIYHLAYGDDIDGLSIGNTLEDIEGCYDLSSRIVIVNNKLLAGEIQTISGETSIQICSEATTENTIELTIEKEVGIQTNYFLLSDSLEIIEVSLNPDFDLTNTDAGNYSIVAVTHNGQLINAIPGNDFNQIQGCIAVSNSVTIQKEFLDGGTISLNATLFCLADSIGNTLIATVDNATGNTQQYIITDADSTIISVPNIPLDLDGVTPGECLIWHVSSLDSLTIELGSKIDEISGGCFDLSDAVAFSRQQNFAGNLSIGGSTNIDICINDGLADIAVVAVENSSGTNYTFVVTDSLNVVISSTDMSLIDFSNAPVGICRVWGVAHDGSFSINEGDTLSASIATGCTSISSGFVQVNRFDDGPACGIFPCEVSAGTIDLFGNNFCVGDGISDIVTGEIQNANGDFMQIVVTNSDSIIISLPDSLSFDVDNAEAGICIVWNIASTDTINLMIGENINNINNSCFDISEGAAFTRIENNGGDLSLVGGLTSLEICISDTINDIINVTTSGVGQSYEYIITDSENVIIGIQDSSIVDLTNAPVGVCRIWGLAHNDVYNQMVGDTLDITNTAGNCFDLSDNFIEVTRSDSGAVCGEVLCEVDGGFIDLFGSMYCVNDGVSDIVTGDVQGAAGPVQQIVVTDSDSIIISLPDSLSFDVDNAPGGTCIVWNLASIDSINLTIGNNINSIQNPCFDLSAGASFIRVANNAGTVSLTNGMTLDTICAGDNIQNALAFVAMNSISDSFQFVITNDVNTILALPPNNSFNFDVLPIGTCRVYGVAYSGAFLPEVGDSLMIEPATNGCFDISENFVTIVKEDCTIMTLNGGSITLSNGSVEFCPGDTTGTVVNGSFMNYLFSSKQDFRPIFEVNLDGDAQPDYIFAQGDEFNWVEHDGSNTSLVTTPLTSDFAFGYGVSEVVDIDNDGDIDVVTVAFAGDEWDLFLLTNDGANNFTATELVDSTWHEMTSSPGEIKVFDLENDGDLDIVAISNISNSFFERKSVLYINDGSQNFTTVNFDTDTPYSGLAVGHLDGNLDADIVVMKRVSQQDSLFLFKDITTTNTKTLIDPNLSDSMFSDVDNVTKLVDMDMDGDLDIVIFNTSLANYIYFNDGLGSFTKMDLVTDIRVEPDTDIQDFDGDGDLDFTTIRGVQINDGSFNFTLVDYDFKIKNNRAHVLISDVDGDGQLDLMNGAGEWYDFESGGYNFEVILSGVSPGSTRWVLTNDQGVIVSIDDQNPPLIYDLIPLGSYNLYHVVYDDTTISGLTIGENISGLSGDFALSNIITLNSTDCTEECLVDGGFVDLFGSSYCVGDGESDFVTGDVQNEVGSVQQIIVTDIDSLIIALPDTLNFDVDSTPAGSCIVWNLASNDTIALMTGMHINTIQNSCFDLSAGASFTRIANSGGEVSINGGGTIIEICVSNGNSDEVTFSTTGGGTTYQYIVTDTFNVILALPGSTTVDFESSPAGECRVWGLATNSVFDGVIGDTLVEPEVAGRCFDLSNNFVTVQRFDTGGPCGTTGNNPPLTIVLNRVGESSNIFDIKNISNDTIDVENYWICRNVNQYDRIGATIVECGSFSNLMAPGEVKGLNLSIDNTDGELAIYNAPDFDNPNAMIHYVEWGSTGHGRSSEAIAANLWAAGDFVEEITAEQSIYFTGQGYSSASWNEGLTNTCGDIIINADIVFSRVGDSGEVIDLENIGTDIININDYQIHQGTNSYRVGDLVVDCGNSTGILNPGDKVGLVVSPMSNISGELALFTSNANASFGPVSDYVQWGNAGNSNESRAVFSGIWTSGEFVPAITAGQSIYYDGDGNLVSDWTEGTTTTCGSPEANKKRIDVRISPNPAVDIVSIKIMDTQRPVTEMQVVDGRGKVIVSTQMEMNNNDVYQMSINDLASGIYFLRMKSSNAVITERFIVAK